MNDVRIGVVGATGAVGTVTLTLLAERGFEQVRAFASSRSAGSRVGFGERELPVEEATADALLAGDLDLCFFSVGTATSRELVPHAVDGGATAIDEGVPLSTAVDIAGIPRGYDGKPGGSGTWDIGAHEVVLPVIVNVSSSKPDGTYGEGEQIPVTITFNRTVTLASGFLLVFQQAQARPDNLAGIVVAAGFKLLLDELFVVFVECKTRHGIGPPVI